VGVGRRHLLSNFGIGYAVCDRIIWISFELAYNSSEQKTFGDAAVKKKKASFYEAFCIGKRYSNI